MKIISTAKLTAPHKAQIMALWNTEYPKQLAYPSVAELEAYLAKLRNTNHFLLVNQDGTIAGWLMTFTRNGARWFAMIVSSTDQGKGYGTQLINVAKAMELELNGWATDHNRYTKQNGEGYTSPLDFYKKNGFTVLEGVRFESEKLSAVKVQWKF